MSTHEIPDPWDDEVAAGLSEEQLLLYRSNLLGADPRITNFAGGNTSAKLSAADPLTGEDVDVLWVKGSGGDLGSMGLDGFATLYLDKVLALEKRRRGCDSEDEMVAFLPHCTFGLNPRAASIDTPLHAFVPHRHVDHMHPDAVIALAAAKDGERLTHEVFEGELAWLPWQRPGFDLGLELRAVCRDQPHIRGIVLGGHGLFSWGDSSKQCYENTIAIINRAAGHLARHASDEPFGGRLTKELGPRQRHALVVALLPALRGRLSRAAHKVTHFDCSEDVLQFTTSRRFEELAARGTSCPDHFLRTKIRPLVLPSEGSNADRAIARFDELLARYRDEYSAYYERCKRPDSPPLRDPDPVVVLVPGVGMFTFAGDKKAARIAAEFYLNAIHVMRGATDVSSYVGLHEQQAFDVEYWQLEEAKLRRLPPPKRLAGKVALISGGAGGIGGATARRLLEEGAAVVVADLASRVLEERHDELSRAFGPDVVRSVVCDVTKEAQVRAAVDHVVLEYGGLDILVQCAGIASAAPIEETSLELWQKNQDVLATGYFLVAREVFGILRRQGRGGAIVLVVSKNGLTASPGAAAYCVAKAAEIQLARCLALEGAPHGIRVNVVNPDAVIRESRIWQGGWRSQRAAAHGIDESEVEEHYRERSLLKRSVFPDDVAEAIYFLASDLSAKSTGNLLNVDGGNLGAFPR